MKQPLCVAPGKKFRLADFDADYTGGIKNKKKAQAELDENIAALADLGYRLYAENRRSLLLVLQGMDTAGKDGTIRHVMQGFNPQSCQVTSFKQPGVDELAHDFLWRISRAAPRKGLHRHLQPLALRRRAGGPRPQPRAQGGVGEPLRADQPVREDARRGRHDDRQGVPAHQQGGAAAAAAIAAGRSEEAVEVQPGRPARSGAIGTTTSGRTRRR